MTNSQLERAVIRAKSLVRQGEHPAALEILDGLPDTCRNEPEFWVARAFVCAHSKDFAQAEQAMDRAIAIDSFEPDYFFTRGRYRLKNRNLHAAVADFTRTIELCDHHQSDYYREPAHFFRAEAYLELGQVELARADCHHVRDETVAWSGSLRTKNDILTECDRG